MHSNTHVVSMMKIQFFCPYWGSETLDFKAFLDKVRKAGYDGVEMSLPIDAKRKDEILGLLEQSGLQLVAQHWETLTTDFRLHKVEFQQRPHSRQPLANQWEVNVFMMDYLKSKLS